MRNLETRDDGYELVEITSIDELDLPAFLPMVDEAWKADYVDQARLEFTEAVYRKLLGGDSWVAVLARDRHQCPVGFELALERVLRIGPRALRAYYASAFTVSVEHRRRGIGSWVLEGINRLVFEDRRADLICSTFHLGHAGSPTVVSTFDRIEGWGVRHLHETKIWSRRLDKDPLPPLESPPRFARIALDRSEQTSEGNAARLRAVDGDTSIQLPDLADVDRWIRSSFEVSFALEASLSGQYLSPDQDASGILLYDFDGQQCLAGYNTMPMSINDHRLRPVGQLQLLLAPSAHGPNTHRPNAHGAGASEARVETLVHHLALHLAERGCFALSLLDMGMVPTAVLSRLGFAPADTEIAFAIRGPRATLDLFAEAQPPFFLDFT